MAAELQLGATHFEAVGRLGNASGVEVGAAGSRGAAHGAVGHITRAEPVVGPTVLQLTIDLQLEVAIGAADEEAIVVARGGGRSLEAGAGVSVREDVLHHAADLVRALLGQPLVAVLRLQLGDLLLELGDLGHGIGVRLDGSGEGRAGQRSAREETNKLCKTH